MIARSQCKLGSASQICQELLGPDYKSAFSRFDPQNEVNVISSVITIAWFTCYLVGEAVQMKPETSFLEKLQIMINQDTKQIENYGNTITRCYPDMATIDKFRNLKVGIYTLLAQFPTAEILCQMSSIMRLSLKDT